MKNHLRLRRASVGLVVAVACVALRPWPAYAEIVDRVLATVDREAILLSDVMREIDPGAYEGAIEDRVRATLQQRIDEKILLREALLAGLEVSDDLVERRLDELRELHGSSDALVAAAEMTMSELRGHIRKQLLARKVMMDKLDEFSKSVSVSQSEVAQYYEDHKSEFERPEQVRCHRVFLLASSDPDERAVIRARMEELREELDAGADFEELAKARSEGPYASKGGPLGWLSRGDLIAPLDEAVFSLQEGDVSDVIETSGGFSILKVDERREAGLRELDDVRTEIEPALRFEAASEIYEKWMADLRKRSRVRILLQ